MAGEYWQREPSGLARERMVALDLPGISLELATASGVFGAQRVDHGTMVLLRRAPIPAACSGVVDVGTGYGPIAVAMGLRQPSAGVWAVDVNRRALELTRRNAASAALANVVAVEPEQVPAALRFDRLYSNPPVKIGREELHSLLGGWLGRLATDGDAYLVVKQSMGADGLGRWLTEAGYPTVRSASKQGYRLLHVTAPPRRRPQDALTADDLAVVNRATGQRWSVLGRLSGGRSDSVQLLGSGPARMVLKIKRGAWWEGQLARFAELVAALRTAGYPTPPVLGFGPLGEDRFYLATEHTAGSQPAALDMELARDVLQAIGLHAAVRPSPIRDWSAMITMFLNGGIADHRFPPGLAGLAQQAWDLVPHPVPALPTGDFVHGDLTTRNLLTRSGRLSAVIDAEGFGSGTRTIDLVSMLATTRPEQRAVSDLLIEQAIAASDESVFHACLAHQVLKTLLSAADHPQRSAAVEERARNLLTFARK
ncbi:MAG: methyltransferase [Catenulispora sp.]|nr:methyltransferase [Catenulispora sp.]